MNNRSGLQIAHFGIGGLKARNCRNLLVPSRVRRQRMAENLDTIWRELRLHTTIEMDQQKLWQLATDLKKSKQTPDARPRQTVRDLA
jgi:hypothetical protein